MTVRHEKMRIAGELVDGDTGKNIEVLNPYNGEVVDGGRRRGSGTDCRCF